MQIIVSGHNFQSGDPDIYSPVGAGSVQISSGSADFSNVDAFLGRDPFENAGLSGSYNYTIKGDSLVLGKASREIGYNYRLKKQ